MNPRIAAPLLACALLLAAACASAGEDLALTRLFARLNVDWGQSAQVDAHDAYRELGRLRNEGVDILPAALRTIEKGNASARMWAAAAIAPTKSPKALTPLLRLLEDEHPKVRMIVSYHIHVFMDLDPRVAPALGKRVGDPDVTVRNKAAEVLRKSKPPSALPEIRKALASDDRSVRVDALRLLLTCEGKQANQEIPLLVKEGENGHVRSAAVAMYAAMGGMDEERALELVGLMGDPDALVAVAALDGLRQLFKRRPLDRDALRRVFEAADKAILEATVRPEATVRAAALPLLGHLKGEDAIPALVSALQRDPADAPREAALAGLFQTKVKGPRIVNPLLAAVTNDCAGARATALKLVVSRAEQSTAPRQLRAVVAAELLRLKDKLFSDRDPTVRSAAYLGLAKLAGKSVGDELVGAVRSETDAGARRGALAAVHLVRRLDRDAVLAALDAMRDADPEVSRLAVALVNKSLRESDARQELPTAIRPLLPALCGDERATVRTQALRLLASVAGAAALDAITRAVRTDPDTAARQSAVRALFRAEIYDARAGDVALEAMRDDTRLVREAGYKVLCGVYAREKRERFPLPFQPDAVPDTRAAQLAAIGEWWREDRHQFAPVADPVTP